MDRTTIAAFTRYVLDDPRVNSLIEVFVRHQRVADKMIDATGFILDEGIIKFDDADDLRAAREFARDMEETKRASLDRIIEGIHDFKEPLNLRAVTKRGGSDTKRPNVRHLPLIMFKAFAKDPQFGQYLYTGQLPILGARDVDLTRQKYLAFALFLWIYYDVKSVVNSDSKMTYYYERARVEASSNGFSTGEEILMISRISTSAERLRFLTLFKDYIHYDLWDSSDYTKRAKSGVIMRLRLSGAETGNVVVQNCDGTTNTCNQMYLINAESMGILVPAFLRPDSPLKRMDLACRTCGYTSPSFFATHRGEKHFYCGDVCYYT